MKGLPLSYMTRQMGEVLGNHLGKYVLINQSRKVEQFGCILQIRVRLDVQKPLRRFVTWQLEGRTLNVDIRYEKLPLTCFLCGMDQCSKFKGRQDDDCAKPYRRWFQEDLLRKDYRKPAGKSLVFTLRVDGL